jgi:hypothetical protein
MKTINIVSGALALISLAGTSGAQGSSVWPQGYASSAGEGAQNAPFTVTASHPEKRTRSMTTMAGASLPFGAGSVINQIAYRRDSRFRSSSYGGYSGGRLTVDIGPVWSAERPAAAFAANWAGAPSRVFDANFDLPAAGPPGASVPPFTIVIPFSQSWTYGGGDMAVDLLYAGSPPGRWRRDAVRVPVQTNAEFRQIGPGCRGSNGMSPYTYPFVEEGVPGRTVTLHLTGAVRPASSSALENFATNLLGTRD